MRPPLSRPMVTQASRSSRGFTATPEIQAFEVWFAGSKAGSAVLPVPVMSLHPVDAVAVCAVLVIQTFPNQLPVASVFEVLPAPIAMAWIQSPPAEPGLIVVPVVRSLLPTVQAAMFPDAMPPVDVR